MPGSTTCDEEERARRQDTVAAFRLPYRLLPHLKVGLAAVGTRGDTAVALHLADELHESPGLSEIVGAGKLSGRPLCTKPQSKRLHEAPVDQGELVAKGEVELGVGSFALHAS